MCKHIFAMVVAVHYSTMQAALTQFARPSQFTILLNVFYHFYVFEIWFMLSGTIPTYHEGLRLSLWCRFFVVAVGVCLLLKVHGLNREH